MRKSRRFKNNLYARSRKWIRLVQRIAKKENNVFTHRPMLLIAIHTIRIECYVWAFFEYLHTRLISFPLWIFFHFGFVSDVPFDLNEIKLFSHCITHWFHAWIQMLCTKSFTNSWNDILIGESDFHKTSSNNTNQLKNQKFEWKLIFHFGFV